MANADHAGWRSRGYLPHLDAPDVVQHVVFRLADSLPARLRDNIANVPLEDRVLVIDATLDEGHGRRDLALPVIAELVQGALLNFDGTRYALVAWRDAKPCTHTYRNSCRL